MSELLNAALAAVNAGAEIVRAGYMKPHAVTVKSGVDFATETDLASEKAMVAILRERYPDHAVVGEEGGLVGNANARFKWLVDPLCGTMNFAAGVPLFSVNLALLEDGVTVLGVMAEPIAGETVVGVRGEGAWVDGTGERLKPSAASRLLLFDDGGPSRSSELAAVAPRVLNSPRFACRALGTALAGVWIARGRMAGGIVLMPGVGHWEAGVLICREAGCVVEETPGLCVIAADRATYDEVRALL